MSSSFRRAGCSAPQQQPSAAAAARPASSTSEPTSVQDDDGPSMSPSTPQETTDLAIQHPNRNQASSTSVSSGTSSGGTTSASNPQQLPTTTTTVNPPRRTARLPGTKPWTSGLTLTSTGLREIDSILGGGQPLGTAILIEEDRWTFDLGLGLARYWSAEAVSQGQVLVLPATSRDDPPTLPTSAPSSLADDNETGAGGGSSPSDLRNFVQSLPRDLHLDKHRSRAGEADSAAKDAAAAASNGGEEGARTAGNVGEDGVDGAEVTGGVASSSSAPFAIIEEEEFDEEEEDDDHHDHEAAAAAAGSGGDEEAERGLKIAWQYRKSVQRTRLGLVGPSSSGPEAQSRGGGEVYCHSYDLQGRMVDQHPQSWLEDENHQSSGVDIFHCSCQSCPDGQCRQTRVCGFGLFRLVLRRVLDKLPNQGDGSLGGSGNDHRVVRILLLDAPIQAASIALPLLLAYVRTRSLPVAVMVTVRPWRCLAMNGGGDGTSGLAALRRSSDVVLATEGFASLRTKPPPEFKDLAGILTIKKMAALGGGHFADAAANRRPPSDRWGMKRDRRKLNVRLLHLPPEEGGSGGGGLRTTTAPPPAARPTAAAAATTALEAGSGCGSGRRGGGGSNSLDF